MAASASSARPIAAVLVITDGNRRTPFDPGLRLGLHAYKAALKRGVVLRPLGDVLYWMPPYCVDDEQLELLAHTTLAAIDEAIACA